MTGRLRSAARDLAPPALCQVAALLPVFVTGAVAVQLEDDLGMTAGQLGLLTSGFFGAGALASIPLGRLGDRIGPGRTLRGATVLSGLVLLAAGTLVRSWTTLAVLLVLAGVSAAAVDPAASLYVSRVLPAHRLGAAIGVKQASLPFTTLIGGLAVPLIAIPFGWRWVYVAGAGVALVAVAIAPRGDARVGPRKRGRIEFPPARLFLLAVAFGAGSGVATTMGAFAVDSGTVAGLEPGTAGLVAALGSLAGLVARLVVGHRSDRWSHGHLRVAAGMLGGGSGALLLVAVGSGAVFVLALPLAFATAGGWAGLLHMAVVRGNPEAPGSAMGLVGTGAFVGCVASPLLFGTLADSVGYGAAWSSTATMALVAAVTMAAVRIDATRVPSAVVEASVV